MFIAIIVLSSIAAAYLFHEYLEHTLERCPRCHVWTSNGELTEGGGYCGSCNDDLHQEYLADMADPESNHVAYTVARAFETPLSSLNRPRSADGKRKRVP